MVKPDSSDADVYSLRREELPSHPHLGTFAWLFGSWHEADLRPVTVPCWTPLSFRLLLDLLFEFMLLILFYLAQIFFHELRFCWEMQSIINLQNLMFGLHGRMYHRLWETRGNRNNSGRVQNYSINAETVCIYTTSFANKMLGFWPLRMKYTYWAHE